MADFGYAKVICMQIHNLLGFIFDKMKPGHFLKKKSPSQDGMRIVTKKTTIQPSILEIFNSLGLD